MHSWRNGPKNAYRWTFVGVYQIMFTECDYREKDRYIYRERGTRDTWRMGLGARIGSAHWEHTHPGLVRVCKRRKHDMIKTTWKIAKCKLVLLGTRYAVALSND